MAEPQRSAERRGRVDPQPMPPDTEAMRPKLQGLKDKNYELFIIALSLLAFINLFLWLIVRDEQIWIVLEIADRFLSAVFLGDFVYRLYTADSKPAYLFKQSGWADLLASVPLPGFKIFRVFGVARTTMQLRSLGMRRLMRVFLTTRAESALLTLIFLLVTVLEFGSINVLIAERGSSEANIKSASDALWWSYVTVTTVGYGDRYPVTNAGRLVGIVVLTTGVGLFAVLTGYLSNKFLQQPVSAKRRYQSASAEPEATLAALEAQIREQERSLAELQARLDELKRGSSR